MIRRDTIAAAVMLSFAAVAAAESIRLLPYGAARNPGPAFFPWWMSVALFGLSLVLLVQSIWRGAADRGDRGKAGVVKVLGVLAVLTVYSLVIDFVGYPLATFAIVLFMVRVTEPLPWPLALGLAVLVAGGSYVVFATWLNVPLPAGLFAR